MKRLGIALAAMAAMAMAALPAAAAEKISKKQHEEGMAGAPAAIQAAKLTCTPTDAYQIQAGQDPKTKEPVALYEVACQEGIGYIIQTRADTAQAYDCLSQAETAKTQKDGLVCKLDANADPAQGFGKVVTTLGHPCTATGARVMGATAGGETFYEVACSGDTGYVLSMGGGKAPEASDCLQTLGGGATECQLTTKAQLMNNMTKLASGAPTPCTVDNARMVGSDKASGAMYYEVACQGGTGYMIQANAQGGFQQAWDCAKAQNIGGGCSLTVVDETAEAGTYTQLAKTAGYPCEVSKYRFLGTTKDKAELVELACSNRPDGGLALFGDGKGQVFDCVQGGALGVTCQLTDPSVVYPKYTERLVAMGKSQCKVSGAKFLASTTAGSDFIETACSDGLPGFVISIDHTTGKTNELLTCGQAARSGAACSLPTNIAKN